MKDWQGAAPVLIDRSMDHSQVAGRITQCPKNEGISNGAVQNISEPINPMQYNNEFKQQPNDRYTD